MSGSKQLWLATIILQLLTVACAGSASPSLPTLSSNDVATVVAATMLAIAPQATATFTIPSAASATALPPTFPVIPSTSVPPAAARINFLTGATEAVVSAPIQPGQTQFYVLKALQGQPMIVMVDSVNQDVTLSITTQGGTSLLSSASKHTTWQGMLPQTEDYYLAVYGGASPENFSLNVTIPSRIQIAKGATKAILTGQTAAGYIVTYAAFGFQGQVMAVDLNGVGNNAALTIFGFADGQPYVRSVTETTSFSMKLPSTQDYMIEVVPRAGMIVNYTLVVKFQ